MTAAWNGVPLNPERKAWHWAQEANFPPVPVFWFGGDLCWQGQVVGRGPWTYLGSCLTPAEVAAALAKARAEGRIAGMEEAAGIADRGGKMLAQIGDDWGHAPLEARRIAAAIRTAATGGTSNDR